MNQEESPLIERDPALEHAGADRLRSNSFTDASSKTEAALRAQLMELRRDLSTSQQEVEQTRLDLQQRQELLKSAAGGQKAIGFTQCHVPYLNT